MSEPDHQRQRAIADSIVPGLFFPRPLPHETIYSVCARFTAANSLPEEKASMYLLGHRRGGFHHEIQHGLSRLERVSCGTLQATQDLLRTRTVLACILPFLSAQRRRAMFERLLASVVPQTLTLMMGMSRCGHDAHHFLRRCPDCAYENRQDVGFSYWHMEHQLFGVWSCPVHGRPLQWLSDKHRLKFNWRQAERDDGDFEETPVDAATLLALDKLAKTILWTTSMHSIRINVLNILVRSRLRRADMVHTEIKMTSDEMDKLHQPLAGPLARTGISHFARFTSPDWINELLTDTRASHPLRWSLLIASTLGDDFFSSGPGLGKFAVKSTEEIKALLNHEYHDALERTPQPPLFKTIYSPRIARAPDALYRALGQSMRLKDAAALAGLSLNETRIWVHRDRMLAMHWRRAISTAKIDKATNLIFSYLRANPKAQRVDLLRAHLASIRVLERYDPAKLQFLLPAAWTKFKWQSSLPFEENLK